MTSNKEHKIKRALFIGPTGAGKSTLINILFNNSVNISSMLRPAPTSDGSAGSTANFTTYYNFPDYAFTDSIGFGDNRFNNGNVLSMVKAIVKNSMVGYNKIYLCMNYGRISTEIRYYVDWLITVFGKKILKWCTIILTHCIDQKITKEKYIQSNQEDTYIIDIINSVENVIFGDNMVDDEMESILINRRQRLLNALKQDIRNSNTQYYSPQPENFTEWLHSIYNMIVKRYAKQTITCVDEINKITGVVFNLTLHQNFADYYGECSICFSDMWNRDSVITKCHHIYHDDCICKWLDKEAKRCPLCRSYLDKKDSFLTPLLCDWEVIESQQTN